MSVRDLSGVSVRLASGASAGGAAVTVTISAPTSGRAYHLWTQATYSATPTGGRLTSSGLVGDEVDLDVVGTTFRVDAEVPADPSVGFGMTLAAPGGAVVGKLVVAYAVLT